MRFSDTPDRWIVLTITGSDDELWYASYEDDRGRRRSAGPLMPDEYGVPPDFLSLIEETLAEEKGGGTLPIFLSAVRNERSNAVAFILKMLNGRGDVTLVWMNAEAPRAAAPFALPLDIAVIGDTFAGVLDEFLLFEFAKEAVDNGAITIRQVRFPAAVPIGTDLVVTDARIARAILAEPLPYPPRAIIVLDPDREFPLLPPPQPAVLVLHGPNAVPARLNDVLLNIVHDRPLHDAMPRGGDAFLFATPESNQSLRMSDAFAALARDALDAEISETSQRVFEAAIEDGQSPLEYAADFMRETTGLLPIGRYRAGHDRIVRGAIPEAVSLEGQRRRVDARIERVEYVMPRDIVRASRHALWVDKDLALRQGGRYRLRIQIGRRAEGNLISDDTPDLILPPTPHDQYELDVALFPKDFEARSAQLQRLKLPKAGASRPIWFEIVAPPTLVRAQLRFAIYLGNHLLQSFLLTAMLAPEETVAKDGVGITVALEAAKSEGFGNLDELRPRAVSIGMNLDDDGMHTLCLKLNEAVAQVKVPPKQLDEHVAKLRAVLEAAAVQDDLPVFSADDAPLTAKQQEVFDTSVRELAAIGDALHLALFARMPEDVKELLRTLVLLADLPLQFPRLDVNLVMPWPVLYDFGPPKTKNAPVCRGIANDGKPCGHGIGDDVYCLNGFWGIRHAVEEHFSDGKRRDTTLLVESPPDTPVLRASDAVNDGFCAALVDDLKKIRADAAALIDGNEDVLEMLWNVHRPAVILFLGHFEKNPPYIEAAGTTKQLTVEEIGKRARRKGWSAPKTLVLLMACGAMQMTSDTLVDHALAFWSAGAAAIVGSEVTIFPKFACRFVREIVTALLTENVTLGRAISDFRRRTVSAGNPLAFAFTCLGEADVAIR